jgi:2-polyprenyl-3-methyl-5-hydroxy-6-metoxy-1,4-benzoquinol methylase
MSTSSTPEAEGGRLYEYRNSLPSHTASYLWPAVLRALHARRGNEADRRVFDLGCGNGSFAAALHDAGYDVTGVDPSETGIQQAHAAYPHLDLRMGSGYDDLRERFGTFPVVVSLEVIEHVYAPRTFVARLHDLLDSGGTAIISTPYHGYLKNLALAVSGKLDDHFTALWDHGHIKFWSERTLATLLQQTGFSEVRFQRAGRLPAFAKSMIAICRK